MLIDYYRALILASHSVTYLQIRLKENLIFDISNLHFYKNTVN